MPQPARKSATARRSRSPKARDGVSTKAPKATQRERLIDAIIELAAQYGYQNVSIAQISARAGVSSATFYEQFKDKEDCLVAAYGTAAARLLAQEPPKPEDGDWAKAALDTLRDLLLALRDNPDAGRLLFVEALAGGPRIGDTRRGVLGAFEHRVQEFLDSTPDGGYSVDIPAIALVGAFRNIIARNLRTHGEDELPSFAEDGIAWVGSYAVPPGRTHWSTGPRALLAADSEQEGRPPAGRRPTRLPRGRHGLPAGVIARSQRTRIIYGTAEVTMAKGYATTTVADIVAAAGVSRDVFYEHFSDKQHAFLEAQQHPTQHILDTCATAYFSAREWPERVWKAYAVLIRMIAENPAISHLRLIECYAAGPDAVRRAEEITRSFTIFLEEGYSYRPEAAALPRLSLNAITGAIFEVIQRHVARGDTAGLARRLPQLTYIAIAPFMGPAAAVNVLEKLSALHDRRAQRLTAAPAADPPQTPMS